MRETKNETLIDLQVINPITGEITNFKGKNVSTVKNYSIKRLNMRIWLEAYEWVGSIVVKSNLDYQILSYIKSLGDENNVFVINKTKLAKTFGISSRKLFDVIERIRQTGFITNEGFDRGMYMLNPFVIISKSAANKGNKNIERLQDEWEELHGVPDFDTTMRTKTLFIK
jgi:predicted transcriptional regulator